jgi:glycosyltransferase involved in cell wall biosynthesis
VLILNQGLPAHGFESELLYGSENSGEGTLLPANLPSSHHIPHLRRGINPIADARAALAIQQRLNERRPSIVHTHMAKAGALGRLTALRAGVPITLHTFHGHVLSGYFRSPVNRTLIEFEKRMARHTTVLIAVSDLVRDELLSFGIGDPAKWRTVPVGLELGDLVNQTVDSQEGRRRLGLPADRPAIGIVGRLAPIKDLNTFLGACELIAHSDPDVIFVVAGDGPLRQSLEEKARSCLGDRISFLGWVSDLTALYAALDVVVLTSRNEGTPVALIEASAAARPVVGTLVGGVADVISDGQTGYLVPPRDPHAVAERVLFLLGNREKGLAMGNRGRDFVRHRFSAERLILDIASLYAELLQY